MVKNEQLKEKQLFPVGEANVAYQDFFVGQSYLSMLVNEPDVNVGVGNVTFEPGCRNNWHIHHAGYQILLVT
ncbi:cupin domain-containing protein, partial [Staphylococcus epidermidis]